MQLLGPELIAVSFFSILMLVVHECSFALCWLFVSLLSVLLLCLHILESGVV